MTKKLLFSLASATIFLFTLKPQIIMATNHTDNIIQNTTQYLSDNATDIPGDAATYAGNTGNCPRTASDDTCTPIGTFPFHEDFDSSTDEDYAIPECWQTINTYTDLEMDIPFVIDDSYDGSNALIFFTYPGYYNIGIMPAIADETPVRTLTVTFQFKFRQLDETVEPYLLVGIMDDPTNAGTFTTVDTVRNNVAEEWTSISVSFANYAGNGQYIAFKNETGWFYIDDLNIDLTPACPVPTNVVISDITTTDAIASWNPGGTETAWEIAIVPYGSDPQTAALPTEINPYPVTELTGDAVWQIYVRADCGDDYSSWTSPVTFRTACPANMTIPYTENFDTYDESDDFPVCWSRITDETSGVRLAPADEHHASGEHALKFYGHDSYAIMPPVNTVDNPVNSLTVSLKLLKTSELAGIFEIGIMSDPDDTLTFTSVARVTASDITETETWQEFDLALDNYTGTGRHIVLHARTTGDDNMLYVDDIMIYVTPACYSPVNVTVSNITTDGADIDWTPRNNENMWDIAVVQAGINPETAISEIADSHPYRIEHLTENTTYDVYVKAYCGDEYVSLWSTAATFTTLCTPQSVSLPWKENFDSCQTGENAALPDCWRKYTNYSEALPCPVETGGTKCINFYSSPLHYTCLVSPPLNLSEYEAGSLHLTCKTLKTGPCDGRLNIGYMTDPGDMSTFVLLKSIYCSDYAVENTFYLQDVAIYESLPTPVYLAFVDPAGENYAHTCLDEIVLDMAPDCSEPSNLHVTDIHGTSAVVAWTESCYGAVSYKLEYKKTEDIDGWITIDDLAGTQILLSGLTPMTDYEVRFSANCDNGDNSDTIVTAFATGCLAGGNATVGDGDDTNPDLPLDAFWKYNYTQQIFDATEMNGAVQIKGIKFDYAGTNAMTKKTEVDIYLAHTQLGSFPSEFDWVPITLATRVYSGSLNCTQGWNTFMFDTVFEYNGIYNLVLTIDDNSGQSDNFYGNFHTHPVFGKTLARREDAGNPNPYDPPRGNLCNYRNNVVFLADCDETATCIAPCVLITDIDDKNATMEWAPGNDETTWQIEYRGPSQHNWTPAATVGTPTYTLPDLAAGSNYSVRVRSVCGPDHYSNWVTLSFTTLCPPITVLPYTENFDAAGQGEQHFIDCWARGTNDTTLYPYLDNETTADGSPYALCFYGSPTTYSYASAPRLEDAIAMDNLTVSFSIYGTCPAANLEVGIMSDPNDYSTFIPVGTATPSTLNNWETGEVNTTHYFGTGHHIAFRIPQGAAKKIYIDNVRIEYTTNCARVTDLTAVDITDSSATVTWTAGDDENSWQYLYGVNGTVNIDTDEPMPTDFTSIPLTGLMPETNYDVFVRSQCQNGEYSLWEHTLFKTDTEAVPATVCPPPTELTVTDITPNTVTLSWTENNTATKWQIIYGITGFDPELSGTMETTVENPFTIAGLTAATDYDFYVRSVCTDTENSEWSTKVTCTTQCGAITTFPYTEDFEHDGNMPPCWSQQYIVNTTNWTFKTGNYTASYNGIPYAHSGDYNAFFFSQQYGNTTVLISPVLDLTQMEHPYISFWHSQQHFPNWDEEPDELTVYCRTSPDGEWTELVHYTAEIPEWTVDSLIIPHPSGTCQIAFEGKANYANGITLDDITVYDGTDVCPMPTNLTSTTITDNSLTLTWEQECGIAEWTLGYKRADDYTWTTGIITDNPHTITGLEAGTTYEAKIRANCPDGSYSDYTSVGTFTTKTTGIGNHTPTCGLTLYPNPASTCIEVVFDDNLKVNELQVYDIYGKLLQSVKVNDNPTRIDVAGLADGLYFVRAFTENGTINNTFIKK